MVLVCMSFLMNWNGFCSATSQHHGVIPSSPERVSVSGVLQLLFNLRVPSNTPIDSVGIFPKLRLRNGVLTYLLIDLGLKSSIARRQPTNLN